MVQMHNLTSLWFSLALLFLWVCLVATAAVGKRLGDDQKWDVNEQRTYLSLLVTVVTCRFSWSNATYPKPISFFTREKSVKKYTMSYKKDFQRVGSGMNHPLTEKYKKDNCLSAPMLWLLWKQSFKKWDAELKRE